ncbi:MAG: serine protease [Bdellovibrionaceae bacterium]|nr:serine protease [Pseudobdellovibrionaceae bacterium]
MPKGRSPSTALIFITSAVMTLIAAASLSASAAAVGASTARPPARKPSSSMSAEDLFRKYKSAVVKVVIQQQKIPIATGTGFFVSADGKLITNHHVVKNALKTGSFSVEFVLADGKVIKDFLVASCRDDRGMDLCLLKLPVKPKSYFQATTYKPSPGESVYVIGHPQGLDFSITNGIVSALRESPTNVKELQITAAISPGNSGGPIFNSRGQLAGVTSKFYKDGQNLNFGILTSEVNHYLVKHTRFKTIAQHRQEYEARLEDTLKRWSAQEIDPAYANVELGHPVSETPGFKDVTFDFGDDQFRVPVPKMFDGCRRTETKKGAVAYQCSAMGNSAVFSISRIAAERDAPLLKLDGRKPIREKPLPIVQMLMEDGTWSEYEKHIPEGNRKYLYSMPSEAKCRALKGNVLPGAMFNEGATQCRFSIYNDLEPDAYSYSIWVQRGGYIYDFYIWMEDAGYASFFTHVPTLAVLGARDLGAAPARPLGRSVASETFAEPVAFSLNVHPSFELSNSETLSDGTRSYMYARRTPSTAASPAIFMVNILKATFPSRDLNARSSQLFQGTLEGFGAELNEGSIRTEKIRIDEMPVVIQTGYGRRKEKDLAVFHATILGEKSTYMVFGFCDPRESRQTLKEFEKMTHSFRRSQSTAATRLPSSQSED